VSPWLITTGPWPLLTALIARAGLHVAVVPLAAGATMGATGLTALLLALSRARSGRRSTS
jgi:hypothetical protein